MNDNTYANIPDSPGITWQEIQEIYKRLHRPVAQAVWFIDRPKEFHRYLEHIEPAPSGTLEHWASLRLINWRLDEERISGAKYPAFIDTPGIWVQMSDGNHWRVDEETDH